MRYYNELFEELCGEKLLNTNNKWFRKLFSEYDMKKQKQTLYLKQRTFDVYTSFYESKTNDLDTMLVCFVETTQYQNLEEMLKQQKTVVALLYLDNYEEVTESLEEIRLPILTAVIDRKLNKLS